MNTIFCPKSPKLWRSVISVLLAAFISSAGLAQKPSTQPSDLPQMLATERGPIAIDTPKGWSRATGPGLAYFLRDGTDSNTAEAWIYVSAAPIGTNEEYRDFNSYIQYDITTFKDKYKNGTVQSEQPILLPLAKARVRAYTFESGEKSNAYEQIIYIEEAHRVLILVLSARNSYAFTRSMTDFFDFARTYRGSVKAGAEEKKP
jgi:hypothetical protein